MAHLSGSTTEASVTYVAPTTIVIPVSLGITCQVSLLDANPMPTNVDLRTLGALGVDNIDANMLITIDEGNTAWFDRDDDSAFDPMSDRTLATGLDIGWINYDPNAMQLRFNRVQSGAGSITAMSTYWGSKTDSTSNARTKAPYIILGNGTIVQFQTEWFDSAGGGFVRWNIDPAEIPTLVRMDTVTDYQYVLVGVGDVGTLDGIKEMASATAIVSIQGELSTTTAVFTRSFIKPIFDKINVGFLEKLFNNTGFNKLESIDNKPRAAYGKINIQVPYYDTTIDQQRYRPVKITIQISSRIDGVSEFSDSNYIVILQLVGDRAAGIRGRSFPVFGVYDKTATTFSVSYEEGITSAAFGRPFSGVGAELLWFARGR